MKVHLRRLYCGVCQYTCKNQYALNQHRLIHINVCTICGAEFKYKRELIIHNQLIHRREKPFCCDICGLMVTTKAGLKDHILRHTDDR